MENTEEQQESSFMKIIKTIWGWVWPALIAIGIVLVIKQFFIEPVHVSGTSMSPNLYDTEQVFCFKKLVPIHRGSVICFNAYGVDPECKDPKRIYVKRVIGLPGDTVVSKNGNIYVNGKLASQSYITPTQRNGSNTGNWDLAKLSVKHSWQKNVEETKVPSGAYFCLGDNRAVSNDSRYFGDVPESHVLGVVKVFNFNSESTHRDNINLFWKHFFEVN